MKPLLNTLFVTTQGAHLAREGQTVAVYFDREVRARIPIHTLTGIVSFGQVSFTPFLMDLAASHGVSLSCCTEHGRFMARIQGPVSGNVLLRRRQYRAADENTIASGIARVIVLAKVANSRTVLLRAAREAEHQQESNAAVEEAARRLRYVQDAIGTACDTDVIRGHEGDAASAYFSVLDNLITVSKEDFFFVRRSRRPPLDNVNALLSFLYTLLAHDYSSALESVGLDPQVGFLHCERPGRPSLALDLVEELRPVLADRLMLSLINRRQIRPSGFRRLESGGVVMDEEARKQVLVAWQLRKQEEILHPFIQERIAFGLVPYVQALLLARFLRGDLDGYPPFFWR